MVEHVEISHCIRWRVLRDRRQRRAPVGFLPDVPNRERGEPRGLVIGAVVALGAIVVGLKLIRGKRLSDSRDPNDRARPE